ncbi:MAG: hypothetical protein AAFX09_09065 [Pseudomonadota bacterium]
MFHANDHLRLMGCDAIPSSLQRRERAGLRSEPRSFDWNGVFERAGLYAVIRRR